MSHSSPPPQRVHAPHTSVMVNRDEEHLRLLGVYHFVIAAGVALLWVFFFVLPLIVGPAYYSNLKLPVALSQKHRLEGVLMYALQTLILLVNGWNLKRRQHWLSCVILSVMECLTVMPLGLLLGVSAVMVLRRDSVRELYRSGQAAL